MMSRTIRKLETSLLIKMGGTASIYEAFEKRELAFGCAANWIDYGYRKRNGTVGDILECVFAHLKENDPRIDIRDYSGRPMGDNLHIISSQDGTCYLRYEPTITTPALCFYSVNTEEYIQKYTNRNLVVPKFELDLDVYRGAMGFEIDDTSILAILSPAAFFEELRIQIPIAVEANIDLLTSERYLEPFDPKNPFTASEVDYDKYSEHELFFEKNCYHDELFWKRSDYRLQNEVRIAIKKINFKQKLGNGEGCNFKLSQMRVSLPNLHTYADVFSLRDIRSITFFYNEATRTCEPGVLRRNF